MQTSITKVINVSIKIQDKQLKNSHHIQVCGLLWINYKVLLTIWPKKAFCYFDLIFSLDLIQSRKETRQQKTLNAKLILEIEHLKEQVCLMVDCENDIQKSMCPDICKEGRKISLSWLRIKVNLLNLVLISIIYVRINISDFNFFTLVKIWPQKSSRWKKET